MATVTTRSVTANKHLCTYWTRSPSTICKRRSPVSSLIRRPSRRRRHSLHGLLTDLHELTMAAGYFSAGEQDDIATFEFSLRQLPRDREFVLAAGLDRAVEYLLNLSFEPDEVVYLRGLPNFRHVSHC